jgi:hypothetical protein
MLCGQVKNHGSKKELGNAHRPVERIQQCLLCCWVDDLEAEVRPRLVEDFAYWILLDVIQVGDRFTVLRLPQVRKPCVDRGALWSEYELEGSRSSCP